MKKIVLFSFLLFGFLSFSQKKVITSEKSFKIIQKKCTLKKGFQLRLKRVFDDSRCPDNVACIWAGEVSVELLVYKNNKLVEEKIMTFNSKNYEENKKWFSEIYKISVKEFGVWPSLKQGVLLNPKDYFVKVIFT